MSPNAATLVVIDVQRAFDDPAWGARNNPRAEANIARLLSAWRTAGAPIVHVRHVNESGPGRFSADGPGFAPKPEAREEAGEPVVTKKVNSAFIGTDLQAMLADRGGQVVCVGLTTDHCVSTTVRMAANHGFVTTVVSDATATFARVGPDGRAWTAEEMHGSALASLDDEFATVLTTDQVLGLITSTARPLTV
jgi:nicotinamidase-related amidase